MLQELAAETSGNVWAIGSMAFFLLVWLGIAVWVYRTRPEEFDRRARLALEGDEDGQGASPERPAER